MAEWQAVMSQAEFQNWQRFYTESPFDDHHRFHRPAVLVAQSFAGGKPSDMFDFLVPPREEGTQAAGGYSAADLATFATLGMTPPKRD